MAVPLIGAAIAAGLGVSIPYLVGRVLAALGFGFVAYTGLSPLMSQVESLVNGAVGSVGTFSGINVDAWLAYAGVWDLVEMWLAAVVSGAALVVTRPVMKSLLG